MAEKKISKHPEKFGTGMIEGVAGPETANNAYANAALIPLFTLGIPGSPTIAILMGAFMMNGLIPGPFLFKEHGEFVWAVIASLYIGNVILLILNLPLIPVWVAILKIPYSILFAVILGFCVIGSFSLDNSVFDVGVMTVFGIIGYLAQEAGHPAGAHGADPHPGADDGARSAPVTGDQPGRLHRLHHPPHLRGTAGHRGHLHHKHHVPPGG